MFTKTAVLGSRGGGKKKGRRELQQKNPKRTIGESFKEGREPELVRRGRGGRGRSKHRRRPFKSEEKFK